MFLAPLEAVLVNDVKVPLLIDVTSRPYQSLKYLRCKGIIFSNYYSRTSLWS
jgi:hypothetical protein